VAWILAPWQHCLCMWGGAKKLRMHDPWSPMKIWDGLPPWILHEYTVVTLIAFRKMFRCIKATQIFKKSEGRTLNFDYFPINLEIQLSGPYVIIYRSQLRRQSTSLKHFQDALSENDGLCITDLIFCYRMWSIFSTHYISHWEAFWTHRGLAIIFTVNYNGAVTRKEQPVRMVVIVSAVAVEKLSHSARNNN
jgi:hypothetical protein